MKSQMNLFNTSSSEFNKTQGRCGIKGYDKQEILSTISRHQNFSNIIEKKIQKIPEIVFQTSSSSDAKKIISMVKDVFKEAERVRQFTRTQLSPKGILSGTIAVHHNITDIILEYFHSRFPQFVICLYNEIKKETYIIEENGQISIRKAVLSDVIEKLSIERPLTPFFDDITDSNVDLFAEFYSSQFIAERENQPYFKKMIPDQCFDLPGMRGGVEAKFRNNALDNYLK